MTRVSPAQKFQAINFRTMNRRQFLKSSASVAGAAVLAPLARPAVGGKPVITKITILQAPGEFHRPVAMNAYDTR